MEQITEDIYRIGVPLTGNPLKEVNSYFIRGDERDLIIDTGFRREECFRVLTSGLDEIGWRPDKTDVLLTHLHSDHSGLAPQIASEDGKIYISAPDMRTTGEVLSGEYRESMKARFITEGFDEALVSRIYATNPARKAAMEKMDERFTVINDGDVLRVGKYDLRAIHVPGHSPGNMMFWIESEGIMFTGDHVLFDITPNISMYIKMPDSLGHYLNSLKKVYDYPVKIALPGHRKSGDYHKRILDIMAHHEKRIDEAYRVVKNNPGLTAYDITGHMTWKIRSDRGPGWENFPDTQRWYAVGECITHLDYMRKKGLVERRMTDGVWRYFVSEMQI